LTGATGAAGLTGATGVTGQTGAAGLTGAIGLTGAKGLTGATGVIGLTGATGLTGTTGLTGATGRPGPTGPCGSSSFLAVAAIDTLGPTGPTGAIGPYATDVIYHLKGATGSSNYQLVSICNGFTPSANITFDPAQFNGPYVPPTVGSYFQINSGGAGVYLILYGLSGLTNSDLVSSFTSQMKYAWIALRVHNIYSGGINYYGAVPMTLTQYRSYCCGQGNDCSKDQGNGGCDHQGNDCSKGQGNGSCDHQGNDCSKGQGNGSCDHQGNGSCDHQGNDCSKCQGNNGCQSPNIPISALGQYKLRLVEGDQVSIMVYFQDDGNKCDDSSDPQLIVKPTNIMDNCNPPNALNTGGSLSLIRLGE
jgi:hypothetical protein